VTTPLPAGFRIVLDLAFRPRQSPVPDHIDGEDQ